MASSESLLIRPYRADDEAQVLALWAEWGMIRWADPKKEIARKLRVNPEWFLVGEVGGRVIGTCMVGYEGHRGWINYLAVTAKQQGSGYGRALMAEAERILTAAGCPKINLQVMGTNTKVLAFYQKLGFVTEEVLSMGKRLVRE